MPNDPLFPLLLALRYMHILGAIMLMGGTIFMRFALAPIVTGMEPAAKAAFHDQIRAKWSKFVMLASGLLLISGITNLGLAARYDYDKVFGVIPYNAVTGMKFLLALPIFLFASFLAGRSATAKKFQANAVMWMNVNLALALLMVLIGGTLRYVPRQPKKADQPTSGVPTAPAEQIASQMLPFERGGE